MYGYRLCTARRYVECAFGIRGKRWRIFQRKLNVSPDFAADNVKTCVVLHTAVECIKRKKISLCEFQSALFHRLWQYNPKGLFFEPRLELKILLEDKYKILSVPFLFHSCLYKYHPSCPTKLAWLPPEILTILCRILNRLSSPLKDSIVQYATDTAVEDDCSDTTG